MWQQQRKLPKSASGRNAALASSVINCHSGASFRVHVAHSKITRYLSPHCATCRRHCCALPCLFFCYLFKRCTCSKLQVAIMDMEMTAALRCCADIHTPPNGKLHCGATCTVQRFNCICLRLMQLGVNQRQICADLQICLLHI